MKRAFTVLVSSIVIIMLLWAPSALSAAMPAGKAVEITDRCVFTCSSNSDALDRLDDGSHETSWTATEPTGQFVQIELPDAGAASGVYVRWNDAPEAWSLLESDGASVWTEKKVSGDELFINAYMPIQSTTKRIRIETGSFRWKMSVAEIRIFGPGTLPDDVQVWQKPPDKADLMVVAAHPDDELIYFGGTLPYYAGQLKKSTVVVYMTSSPMIRKFEALDGLWKVGVRQYPVFLPLANKYTSEIGDAEIVWDGMDNVVSLLVEQIRRFMPDVLVTHDLNGEYGHGAHKLTAQAVEKAVDSAAYPGKYVQSADKYGTWQVRKCYLHLYSKYKIKLDWNQKLSEFGGKTALEMAKEGYALHVSQHFRERSILDSGDFDNSAYGLYYTAVGPDKAKNDFFENIGERAAPTEEAPTATTTPKPAPTATEARSTPASTQGVATSAQQGKKLPGMDTVIAVVVMMLAAAGLLVLANRRSASSARHAKKKP